MHEILSQSATTVSIDFLNLIGKARFRLFFQNQKFLYWLSGLVFVAAERLVDDLSV